MLKNHVFLVFVAAVVATCGAFFIIGWVVAPLVGQAAGSGLMLIVIIAFGTDACLNMSKPLSASLRGIGGLAATVLCITTPPPTFQGFLWALSTVVGAASLVCAVAIILLQRRITNE